MKDNDTVEIVNERLRGGSTASKLEMGFLSRTVSRIRPLLSLASPIIVTAMIREISEVSTIVYVGRCAQNGFDGAVLMGAATLGNMMCNITGFSLAYGLCSALDTLISQAYGAKAYRLTGLYAQRAAVILTLSSIPVALLWSQTRIILQYGLGIPHETAILAGKSYPIPMISV
jgi:MATE family multidrug resistance protein